MSSGVESPVALLWSWWTYSWALAHFLAFYWLMFTQGSQISELLTETRNITGGDEKPQLVPDNIHMYENFKGP